MPSDPARTVLVVDDEPLIRWALREGLHAAGYDVLEASTSLGTLAAIAEGRDRIVAVLLDLRLPDCSDLTLLRTIRHTIAAPVILMTAHGSKEIADAAIGAGAERVLFKPFDVARVVAVVDAASGDEAGEGD